MRLIALTALVALVALGADLFPAGIEGSYKDSCSSCVLTGTELKCSCKDLEMARYDAPLIAHHKITTLNTVTCSQPPFVINKNGELACSSKTNGGYYYSDDSGMYGYYEPVNGNAGVKISSPPPSPSPLPRSPSYPQVYKASLNGASSVPPVSSKATGLVSISLINFSYASGYFYATNINGMTAAHLHSGAVGKTGPPIAWAYNSSFGGSISGSIKASFTFDPSLNNISALLAAGLVFFNVHTASNPTGELRGQLTHPTRSYSSTSVSSCSTSPTVCEVVGGSGVDFSITCPTGTVISSISSAFYGRLDTTTCPYTGPWGDAAVQNTACSSTNVMSTLEQSAIGLQSYSLDYLTYSDPCPGTFKYFKASWCCGL